MKRPLFDRDDSEQCCGTCKYNYREKKDTFSCANEDSEYYASLTSYEDSCDEWEGKDE